MKSLHIHFRSIDEVKEFINIADNIEGDATLSDGRHTINAKSIMGVYTLNLQKPLELTIKDWKDEYAMLFEKLATDYLRE